MSWSSERARSWLLAPTGDPDVPRVIPATTSWKPAPVHGEDTVTWHGLAGTRDPTVERKGLAMLFGTGQVSVRQSDAHWLTVLRAAADAGMRGVDTAPLYADGRAERLVGRLLRERSDMSVQTKVGLTRRVPLRRLPRPLAPAAVASIGRLPGVSDVRHVLSPISVVRQVERSLRRLGRSEVDCLLIHEPHTALVGDDLVATLEDLKRQGRTVSLGLAGQWSQSAEILARYPGIFDAVQVVASELPAVLADGPDIAVRVHGLVSGSPAPGAGTRTPVSCLAWLDGFRDVAVKVEPIVATRRVDHVAPWGHALDRGRQ